MIIWLKRGFVSMGLMLLILLAVLYFWSAAMVEVLLRPYLEARGGELEIESIRVNLDGIDLRIERYEQAGFLAKGLSVSYPWSQLGAIRDGFGGRVAIEELRLRPQGASADAGVAEAEAEDVALAPAAQMAALAAQINELPLSGLEMVVDALVFELPRREYRSGVDFSLLREASGETHLAVTLVGEGVELEVRVTVREGAAGLALDLVATAREWEKFQASYLGVLTEGLAASQLELFLNPLGEGRGFLDVSGYARWDAAEPEALSFTLLADVGAGEIYFPQGELLLQAASFGLAGDGQGQLRAYGKGALDAVRVGSWMQSGVDWALRLDGSKLVAELRVADQLSLSIGHDDWAQLLQGGGAGRFYLEAGAVDAAALRALKIAGLPDDLALDSALQVEGEGTLDAWQPAGFFIKANAQVASASVDSKGLSLADMEVGAHMRFSGGEPVPESLELSVGSFNLLGFTMNALKATAVANESGVIAVGAVTTDFMGGVLRIEPMQIDPQDLEGTVFRARLDAVDLSQLAGAVPQFEGDLTGGASGYLVGEVRGGQLILTDGRLEVDPEQGARLSYDVQGLLTRGMAKGSPAYKQYRMAEVAFQDLALKRLRIEVFPEGNATRPFRLELFGESLQGGIVVPVDFNLNVNVDDTAGLLELLRMIQRGELELN